MPLDENDDYVLPPDTATLLTELAERYPKPDPTVGLLGTEIGRLSLAHDRGMYELVSRLQRIYARQQREPSDG